MNANEFERTRRKAKQGNADAQFALGEYYNDKGDYIRAALWFGEAALKHEHIQAMFSYAVLNANAEKYSLPNGDAKIAVELYEKLVYKLDKKNPLAMTALGTLYCKGKGAVRNPIEGRRLIEEGVLLMDEKKFKGMSPRHYFDLGNLYFNGETTTGGRGNETSREMRKALSLYKRAERAIEPGSDEQFRGLIRNTIEDAEKRMSQTIEVETDKKFISDFLKKYVLADESIDLDEYDSVSMRAQKGNVQAQYKLALMHLVYDKERRQFRNIRKAIQWFEKAAQGGDVNSRFILGYLYGHGIIGLESDTNKSFRWLEKAAVKGHADAQYLLSNMYKNNTIHSGIITYDNEKKMYWLTKAAEQGHTDALFDLGIIYLHGETHTARDIVKARALFEQAAEKGHAKAKEYLDM